MCKIAAGQSRIIIERVHFFTPICSGFGGPFSHQFWSLESYWNWRHILIGINKFMIFTSVVLDKDRRRVNTEECSGHRIWYQVRVKEKEMATHPNILALKIPWMEELGAGHYPWGRKESGTTERLHFTSLHRVKEEESLKDWETAAHQGERKLESWLTRNPVNFIPDETGKIGRGQTFQRLIDNVRTVFVQYKSAIALCLEFKILCYKDFKMSYFSSKI